MKWNHEDVFGQTPAAFTQAMERTLCALEEKKPARKIFPRAAVIALALVALALTACALTAHFTVSDYNSSLRDGAAFQEHITEVGYHHENAFFTFHVQDAVFDGVHISLAMDILPKPGAESVYLYPQLTAFCQGKQLDIDIEGCTGGDFFTGFWVGENAPGGEAEPRGYGVDAVVMDTLLTGKEEVTWTLSFQVLRPLWPVDMEPAGRADRILTVPGSAPEEILLKRHEAYMDLFRQAWADKRILLTERGDLLEWASVLPVPKDAPDFQPVAAILTASGSFALEETTCCTFQTVTPETRVRGEGAYQGKDYALTAQVHSTSFLGGVLEIVLTAPSDEIPDGLEIRTPKGMVLDLIHLMGGMEAGVPRTYLFSLRGEMPPEALELVPYRVMNGVRNYDQAAAFLIPLEKEK